MKAFVAVARREILEKRFIFWVALGVATQPFMVPIVRSLGGERAREVRDITAVLLSVGMAAAIAAALGSSIFAGELAARRMGFYFSRPISSGSLWAGKLAGTLLLTLTAFAVVAGPVLLVDGTSGISRALPVDIVVLGLLLVPLVLVTSAAATVIRSRSRVALADLVAGVVVTLLWVGAAGRFNREANIGVYQQLWVLAAIVVVAFGAASLRSVTRGRTDFAAAHATLSATLWALLAAPAVALAIYLAWATAAPATALAKVSSAGALGHTEWITLSGSARGLDATYLYEPRTGRSQRLPREVYLSVSPDGKVAAWLESDSRQGPWTLFTLDLINPASRPIETKVVFRNPDWPLALSPDGSRVATVNYGIFAVHEIASGRLLLSAPIRAKLNWALPWFAGPDRVRVLGVSSEKTGRRVVSSAEADIASRSLVITGTAEDVQGFVFGPESELVLLRRGPDRPRELCDARTLRPIATLANTVLPSPWVGGTAFLSDRIVIAGSDEKASRLSVFSKDGSPLRTIPVGGPGNVRIGGEPRRGELFAALEAAVDRPDHPPARSLYLVDLERGSSRKVAEGLRPIVWWFWGTAPAPGSEPTTLFVSDDEKLVRLDPSTGERRVLLGGR